MTYKTPKKSHERAYTQFDQDHTNDLNRQELVITTSFVTVTELPIYGYLSIDGEPVYFSQKIPKENIARLLFNVAGGIKRNYYGNFKFTMVDSNENLSEHSFVIDADIINKSLEIENDFRTQKDEYKESLEFKAKRKSDFDFENNDTNWLDATNLDLFEE